MTRKKTIRKKIGQSGVKPVQFSPESDALIADSGEETSTADAVQNSVQHQDVTKSVQKTNAEADDATPVVHPENEKSQKAPAEPVDSITPVFSQRGGQSKSTMILALLALVLSALAMSVGGYAWYLNVLESRVNFQKQQTQMRNLDIQLSDSQQSQAIVRDQINQLQMNWSNSESDLNSRLQAIRDEMSVLSESMRQISSRSTGNLEEQIRKIRRDLATVSESTAALWAELDRGIDSWTLEEIEQLVSIADYQIRFNHDVGLAIHALRTAEDKVVRLADPSLSTLQQQLTADINLLGSMELIDPIEILDQLQHLSEGVNSMVLAGDLTVLKSDSTTENNTESTQSPVSQGSDSNSYITAVVNAFTNLLDGLFDLIQIERNGESIKPVVSDQQRQLVYERTRLLLESAKVALLRQQYPLFLKTLDSTNEWVKENFSLAAETTVSWLELLTELHAVIPDQQTPDLSVSLRSVRNAMEQ